MATCLIVDNGSRQYVYLIPRSVLEEIMLSNKVTIAQNTDLCWQDWFCDVLEVSNVREHIDGELETLLKSISLRCDGMFSVIVWMDTEQRQGDVLYHSDVPMNVVYALENWVTLHEKSNQIDIMDSLTEVVSEELEQDSKCSVVSSSLCKGRLFGAVICFSQQATAQEISPQVVRDLQEILPMALAMYRWRTSPAGGLESSVKLIDRTTFFSIVQTEIERQKAERQPFGVALVDLDRFMFLGDALGHDVLDKALHIIAKRIRMVVSQLDDVTWLGGDEFAVLFRDPVELNDIAAGSQKIADFIRKPLRIAGKTIRITASIGVAVCTTDIVHPHELLRHANTALKDVKYHGKDGRRVYDGRRDNQSSEQLVIENELYTAIDNHELSLVYQPRIRTRKHGEVSIEALLRWNHPTRGHIAPGEFIPLAEQSRLIVDIGEWVMSEVCRQLDQWKREGLNLPRIAVNVSAKQLARHDFLARLEYWRNRYGIEAKYLEVEITETALIDYSSEMLSTIDYLRCHGITVSIDDFGTGYASLETLKQFPVDALKIDQSFVRDLTERNQAIVATVIQLAHSLNSKVIAEGVEAKEQQDFLLRHSCDEFQGYLYSRPVSAVDIVDYISNPDISTISTPETV